MGCQERADRAMREKDLNLVESLFRFRKFLRKEQKERLFDHYDWCGWYPPGSKLRDLLAPVMLPVIEEELKKLGMEL